MGVLEGKRCYISGPIEFDNGDDWRTPIKKFLREDLKLIVSDPLEDSKQSAQPELLAARARKDYEAMSAIAKIFVERDLGLIDRMDFIISYVPHKVPTIGTIHEIVVANNAKKAVLLLCPQGKEMAGLWFFGALPHHRYIFGNWGDLTNYLLEVDMGKHMEDRRWRFLKFGSNDTL
jgi:hypothetical protein